MKYRKILLIGLGNIGLRHLEAMLRIKTNIEISCYDKLKKKYKEINKLLDTNNFKNNVRIGVGAYHISNAGIGYRNPGSEHVVLRYHIPF